MGLRAKGEYRPANGSDSIVANSGASSSTRDKPPPSTASSFSSRLLGRVVVLESGGPLQLRDEGIQHAVGMVERALIEKLGVLGVCDALGKRRDDAGLADALLAGDEHDLPLAFPGVALALP